MSLESDKDKKTAFAEAAAQLGDSGLGVSLGIGCFLGLYVAAIALAIAAAKWDGHLHDRKGCVQLQEVKGQIFKVDTCTGDTEKLPQDDNAE